MHRFFAPGFSLNEEIELPEDEGHHLAKVMRIKTGARIVIFDGRGHESLGEVRTIAGRRVIVRALEARVSSPEPAIAITLGQALLKGDKMDRVVRDAVMLGAVAIQPLISARTEVPRAAVRASGRQERWERTVISSMKQCGRSVMPRVYPAREWSAFVGGERDDFCLMFVEPSATAPDGAPIAPQSLETRVPAKATILVGPEGGWDPAEVAEAAAAGVTLVTLGQRVLRADAAGALAIVVMQYVWKDL